MALPVSYPLPIFPVTQSPGDVEDYGKNDDKTDCGLPIDPIRQ
jgi:hypothetical protein